jgi:hypothetical protein
MTATRRNDPFGFISRDVINFKKAIETLNDTQLVGLEAELEIAIDEEFKKRGLNRWSKWNP